MYLEPPVLLERGCRIINHILCEKKMTKQEIIEFQKHLSDEEVRKYLEGLDRDEKGLPLTGFTDEQLINVLSLIDNREFFRLLASMRFNKNESQEQNQGSK
jgi:hypothetical protein